MTACSVTMAVSSSRPYTCSRRFSSSRNRAFSSLSVSAWRSARSSRAFSRFSAAFSSSRAVTSAKWFCFSAIHPDTEA